MMSLHGKFSWVNDAALVIVDERGCQAWMLDDSIPEYALCDENTTHFYREMMSKFKQAYMTAIQLSPKRNGKQTMPLDAIMGSFNELPLIGYWQKGVCMFLRDMAQFVEGTITWELEDESRVAECSFEKKEVVVREGVVQWNPDKSLEELSGMPKLPKREQFTRAL
jgi:hypothetical protein